MYSEPRFRVFKKVKIFTGIHSDASIILVRGFPT